MGKFELLAPAGDLNRLKIAILYGADAVFIGGKIFSLRAKASNFTIEDIKEGVVFAKKHNAKVYITVNIVPQETDFNELDAYLLDLDKANIDAIIVSSITVLKRAKELGCKYEVHISTQHSIANSLSVDFFKSLGADRVVLARETSIEDITTIKQKTNFPLEVFIHGGVCSSFSGRCTLSNFMVNRDANKGGCAHSCRWFYSLYKENSLLSDDPFTIASYDLMAIDYIPKLIDANIDSFKIEGRMKSSYYIANIVRIYRNLIDTYVKNKSISKKELNNYKKEILNFENRALSPVFLNKNLKNQGILLDNGNSNPSQSFIGFVLSESNKENFVLIEQRNHFKLNEKVEIIGPNNFKKTFTIKEMYDIDGNSLDVAKHAQQLIKIKVPFYIPKDSFIRKKGK